MALKRYSRKESLVFAAVILPYATGMNALAFGACIFGDFGRFMAGLGYALVYWLAVYLLFGAIAVVVQKKFPHSDQLFRRITYLLPVFYVLNILAVSGYFFLLGRYHLLFCEPDTDMLAWAVLYACLMSTFITFINEAVAHWEAWRLSLAEAEKLKMVYQRSRVLGLRGQINPHFLFNCFNTLSGLIQEDEEKAERFLDEMTRVHRYLLRTGDEWLVPLEEELKFAASYLYLARERFGEAIQYTIAPSAAETRLELPPLSMHVILENIIYGNALDKQNPLQIYISLHGYTQVQVTHSLHAKAVQTPVADNDGLLNLQQKFEMLQGGGLTIETGADSRTLLLPLFPKKEGSV